MAGPGTLLVLGATGFVGGHLDRAARRAGFAVVGTSRRAGEADLVCDLLDASSVADAVKSAAPAAVANLVALSSVSKSFELPALTFDVNTVGTVRLLDMVARHAPDAHLLCVSSGDVYGAVDPGRLPAREEYEPRPASPYAASKAALELACEQYRKTAGLKVATVRAFNHTGPGQSDSFVASSFARQIAETERAANNELTLETGDLEVRRDFSDVRDIVRAYLMLIERRIDGTFNACSGRGVRMRELVDLLATATDLRIRSEVRMDRLRPSEVRALYGSADRLRERTGWEPQIPLAQTLADLLGWWRERVRR
jgi:GDP-4-dehydro-6-deoxy-D-mannose reductase